MVPLMAHVFCNELGTELNCLPKRYSWHVNEVLGTWVETGVSGRKLFSLAGGFEHSKVPGPADGGQDPTGSEPSEGSM